MQSRAHGPQDSKALAVAALLSLGLVFSRGQQTPDQAAAVVESAESTALEGLLSASTAREAGTSLLGDPTASARLSFAPEHDRLVWRVGTDDREVLLDAETGEALGFEFE
jgi:hypothetical protein